ncbi:class II fructose-bisphosphate aldolase [Frankia sp. B2]|uniref:class II fructose-bisphosphate aldolase n=1 Tax=Frankia sp. B2 TaxID=2541730 RepID=UPI00141B8FD7|nr:class II fructose-bisphosphate aldolase [Frankia sp. B2]
MSETPALTVSELISTLSSRQALCAFNVENFDTLKPAMRAAADTGCPVIVSFTVPAAQYLGYELVVRLVGLLASTYGVRYALHLDHCENPAELISAVAAGFSSGNFLDEGLIPDGEYVPTARRLRNELSGRASLEFVLGRLGHAHDAHPGHTANNSGTSPSVEALLEFANETRPDILGFDCGSLHGMSSREQDIDIELVRDVSVATGLPVVLHGSSGVRSEAIQEGIDAGIRKINVETALRKIYMASVQSFLVTGGPDSGKPRYLTRATDEALSEAFTHLLEAYTMRRS